MSKSVSCWPDESVLSEENCNKYIYHYTSAKTFFEKILPSGKLRLGPLRTTNDLFEHLDWPIQPEAGDCANFDQGSRDAISIADFIKDCICLASFSCDQSTCQRVNTQPGFSIAPMWGNYAEKNTGVCLVFDRDKIKNAVSENLKGKAKVFPSKVKYESNMKPVSVFLPKSGKINLEQVRKQLIDNKEKREKVLFTKHISWMCEQEFRIAAICEKPTEVTINIEEAFVGIVLGCKFDWCWLQESCKIRRLLDICEHVSIYDILFQEPYPWEITEKLKDGLKPDMYKRLF
jgi:hypothetical protein